MISTIRTTIVGGVFFLVPFGILVLVIDEVFKIAGMIAAPLVDLFPPDDIFGITSASIISWFLVLLACYLAGLVATTQFGRVSKKLDDTVAQIIPGYRLIKSSIAGMISAEETSGDVKPVEVHQFGTIRWAFEVDRSEDGEMVLVFFPGVPNPRAGSLKVVPLDWVKETSLSPASVLRGHEFYGRDLLKEDAANRSGAARG